MANQPEPVLTSLEKAWYKLMRNYGEVRPNKVRVARIYQRQLVRMRTGR